MRAAKEALDEMLAAAARKIAENYDSRRTMENR